MSEQNVESFDCDCEFDFPEGDSWHYWRTCKACGFRWGGLHCPHDGYQNPCPSCGVHPEPEPIVPPQENPTPDWDKIKKLAQRMNGLVDEIEKEIESEESRPFQNCFEDCPLGREE